MALTKVTGQVVKTDTDLTVGVVTATRFSGGSANNIRIGDTTTGCSLTSGTNNNFFGSCAGCSNTTADNNNFLGQSAGLKNTTGGDNNFLGFCAGANNTSGCNNIAIGCLSGTTGGATSGLINLTTGSNCIIIGNDNHTCAAIKIAFTVTSDIRDKHVFGCVQHGRDFLRNINPIKYSFKDRETNEITDEIVRYGFSAQEVMEQEGDDPVITNFMNGEEKLGLTNDYFLPVLVNAIKELDQENTTLKTRLETLEVTNADLLARVSALEST